MPCGVLAGVRVKGGKEAVGDIRGEGRVDRRWLGRRANSGRRDAEKDVSVKEAARGGQAGDRKAVAERGGSIRGSEKGES